MIKTILNFIKSLFVKKTIIPFDPGLIESPPDYRDVLESLFSKDNPTPDEYQIPYKLTVTNQRNTPYCVGHACATIKEYLERREGHNIQFDPKWIYDRCKELDNRPDVRGTWFRIGLKVLKNMGAMPVGGGDPSKYRIGGYTRIDKDFKSLKRAIYEHGAILIGFTGSNQGWRTAFIREPLPGERTWGHATTGVSHTVEFIDAQNSWGKNWGDKGLFHFAKEYSILEAWCVLSDLPNNWKELLAKEEDRPKHFFDRNLWKGLRNDEVVILQDVLKWLGCFNPKVDSTGYYGPITTGAVKCYQRRKGIRPVSGYFGPITRASINERLSE